MLMLTVPLKTPKKKDTFGQNPPLKISKKKSIKKYCDFFIQVLIVAKALDG